MIALLCFFLRLLVSPFKSTSRLEAENAALRHQLIILQRTVRGRAELTNADRIFFILLVSMVSVDPQRHHDDPARDTSRAREPIGVENSTARRSAPPHRSS